MTPEGKLTQLKRERDLLQQQVNMLTAEMSEKKFQRPALEANIKSVQITLDVRSEIGDAEGMKNARTQIEELKRTLLDVEESLQTMNQRMGALQRDSVTTSAEINRTEAEAANTANRIRSFRHNLRRAKSRPAPELSSPAYASMVTSIQGDLRVSENKYVSLTGEVLPPEAA